MPENKSKFLIPAVGTVLIVAGGIAAYMYFKGGTAGDISGAVPSAKVVPNEALMATYISTDPKVWAKLEQFGTPEAQKLVAKGLENFNQDVLNDSNFSYEKDLKPWIGGVMIAVLPTTPTKPAQFNGTSPTPNGLITKKLPETNTLMVVGIKDKLAALNFANKLKGQKGVTTKEIDYKGQKITETISKGKPTYSAVLNNHVVFAPEKQAVEQAIDTFKGEPSFITKEGANTILSKGVNLENTVAQVYIPDYASTVQQAIATSPQAAPLPPQTLTQLKSVKSMVFGVGIDDAGVRMKAIANLDPALVKFQYQNTPSQVVSQLPADTIALISGQGINKWWSALVEQSKDYPEFKQALEQARAQLRLVNIDLDKEIFGWMDGEFGFAAIPANQGLVAQVGFGGAFLFHTSDRKTAEAIFTKLDTLAKTQQINIASRNIGGKDVIEWQVPRQGALLAHGWLNQNTLAVTVGDSVVDAIAASKGQSLDSSENFKAVTGSLQKPNGGYFYLDMNKILSLINRFTQQSQPLPPEANAVLSSIHGVGITANSPDNSIAQMEILLALKQKTK
ncbi:DUF3352 domain-containing protein [Chlorogloeopsis sp. ULAP01]|uniref:DUF3352 domain-containing protein n=1 Tax=Chlorogloeopsis sp. ULAP01 TaxID=3056483 RepID=UPI0025AB1AB0|nr:DUF3352 domain-containing protein [Chlorogloeopsis sp. ULAP01]MDM9380254.1 DUF3352 domain-containing protein [Chlorogloeopsis sp. ULAP01]